MPNIEVLKTKLLSIPGKRERKNLTGKLQGYRAIASLAADSLSESQRSLQVSSTIFPGIRTNTITSHLAAARKAAEKIHAKLQADPANVLSNSVAEKFTELKERTDFVRKNSRETWKRLVESRVNDFSGLVLAATDAGLEGAAAIQATISRLQNESSELPNNEAEVQRIASEFEQVEKAVSLLNLAGKGGKFLIAAASGRADPRALLEEEVVEFINKYNLWEALSVRLG